jgi:inner membrane protein
MATFVMHPVFGAGAAYLVARGRADAPKFIALSALCQWLPDIDTLAYLVGISETHPLGHRGLAHSLVFASLVAWVVMQVWYRPLRMEGSRWWSTYSWFFLMTGLHGVFDAMTQGHLGVAFFWPFDHAHYALPWQPLPDIPIAWSALRGVFWQGLWVEVQFFSVLFVGLFILLRLQQIAWSRLTSRLPRRMSPAILD